MLNVQSTYVSVPIRTPHEQPCPDCGSRLLLGIFHGRLQYRCETTKCSGNAGADENGKPLGMPIDKWGRRKRWELHSLIDPYWNDPFGSYWENSEVRSLIYQYFGLYPKLVNERGDFHIAYLNHEQLDFALEIAKTKFVWYMKWSHIEKKESVYDQVFQC